MIDNIDTSNWSETDKQIIGELSNATAGSPVSSKNLAILLNISDSVANPVTRLLVFETMKHTRIAIAANNNGYWLIQNEKELRDYVIHLENRIAGIKQRIKIVNDCWYERNGQD